MARYGSSIPTRAPSRISILPDEDCCQLFSSKVASTRGHPDDLLRIERTADVEELVEQLAESAELFHPTLEEPEMATSEPR